MKNVFALISFLLISFNAFSQIHITGKVIDISTGNVIPDVIIIFPENNKTITSDENGAFDIMLDKTEYFISTSHIAFEKPGDRVTLYNIELYGPKDVYIEIEMLPKNNIFQPVVITASRADQDYPVTYTNISGSEIEKLNFGEDLPFLLESIPSVVVTSDAGNGVGYTGIRIRGSDATRVNITINGVPYNDAESQQTYWVDLPDFAASVDDIQIQRGVGLSTFGVSSLGGSVNIFTNNLGNEPFAKINASAGSFNLLKASAAFGTGKINDHWYFEGRASKINSDGFIDRSFSDLSSFFITGAYVSSNYKSIVNIFSGKERTYQSWGGVPAEIIDTNRTFNPYTYSNQTDNYIQTHYQWHNTFFVHQHSGAIQLTLNYSKGAGYYEQLEVDQYFPDYGIDPVIIGVDTVASGDLITRKWLDNDYYGTYLQYSETFKNDLSITAGGAWYIYSGTHFGRIIWSEFASTTGPDHEWYNNDALKNDGNIFTQLTYRKNKFIFLLDGQVRKVNYDFLGLDAFGNDVVQNVDLLFINPKAGVTFKQNTLSETYLFFGRSGKEPNRDDYVESSPLSRPSPEILYNVEVGERIKTHGWQFMLNYYLMYYRDQLVLTGEINDVGAFTRTNIPSSYRTGIELAWSKLFFEKLAWNANASFSRNIIIDYVEYVDNWDDGTQTAFNYHNTQLAFSPSVVAYNNINYPLISKQNKNNFNRHTLSAGLTTKYVGKQYADNTENEARSLDAYLINDITLNYKIHCKSLKEVNFNFIFQNFINFIKIIFILFLHMHVCIIGGRNQES
ncbi:MAG: TonB-dependent receptor, partial [Chitinophagales bacterium]